jgi:uncharacterized damage-inducible protein DinB
MKTVTIFIAALLGATAMYAQNLSTELKQQWTATKDTITKSADRFADADYSFKPTAGNTRTFAQVIGHIADAHLAICGAAKGEQKRGDAEMTKSKKADAVAALKASNEYCDSVYGGLTEASAAEQIPIFGGMRSRLSALYSNIIHDNEMYGQIVVYYRAKGMVPPSTADRPATGGGKKKE